MEFCCLDEHLQEEEIVELTTTGIPFCKKDVVLALNPKP